MDHYLELIIPILEIKVSIIPRILEILENLCFLNMIVKVYVDLSPRHATTRRPTDTTRD